MNENNNVNNSEELSGGVPEGQKADKAFRPFYKTFKFKVVIALVLIVAVSIVGKKVFFQKEGLKVKGLKKEEVAEKVTEATEEKVLVKVFKVDRFNYEDSLNVLGTLKGGLETKLSFEIPGVINSINYREGEFYEEGALLISLRQDDILLRLRRAQAELSKAQTAQALAEEKLSDHQTLFKLGAIPEGTLEKVQLEVDSSRYDVEGASLEVRAHESTLEKSNLYAPSDGMIGELYVEEGETVTPNTLIGSHINTEYVLAEFGVTERDLSKLALGQKTRIFIDAFPDKSFEGIVDNIAPVVTGSSRTATGRIRIDNPEDILLPGMFARIKILLYAKKNTLVVPTECVQGKEGENFVFIIDPESEIASKRMIKIGYTRPDYSQVDAGLDAGEFVAITAIERLEEGTKTKIVEKQEAEL